MNFQTPKGTRDFLPKEMERRRDVFSKMVKVFKRYGFEEVSTPAFEDFDLLAKKAGPDIEKELYVFEDKAGRKLGLRFDLTVPIARLVANDTSSAKPTKFFTIGNMWRYDQPQSGRWREFWQADIEIIGSPTEDADAEVLAVVNDCLKEIGIKNFFFRINSRNIVEEFARKSGITPDKKFDAFRAIDKLGKIGEEEDKKEIE